MATIRDIRRRIGGTLKVVLANEAEIVRQLNRLQSAPAVAPKRPKDSSTVILKDPGQPAEAHRLSNDEFTLLARQYGEGAIQKWMRTFASKCS